MNFIRQVIFHCIIYLSLLSCENSPYDVYQSKNVNDPWMVNDTLAFNLSLSQLDNRNLEIEIRHFGDFKYENLYVGCSDGAENTTKVFSIPLANQKGQWIGRKSGKQYIVRYPMKDIKLENEKTLKITHQAREDALSGVSAIGFGIAQLK